MSGQNRAPRWVMAPPPNGAAAALASALGVPVELAALLCARGHASAASAREFLRPRREQLHDARALHGMDVAVARLLAAVERGETVLVHGDYDVDGICSTTILTRTLRTLGGRVVPFIPDRLTDGYDLSAAGVRAARAADAAIVVTCDCGTTARAAIAELRACGIDVVVTDHHLPTGELPAVLALVNPRQPACGYPDKDLCAAALAFKLALALVHAAGHSDGFVWEMLDLVALATVADVAPLRGENRVLVRYGLRMLAATRNVGLRALLRSSGMDGKPLSAGRLSFTLAPRLNAAGRIGNALRGVELLLTGSEEEANAIARELEELNGRRQQLDRATLDEARRMADALPADVRGIVLAREGWHPGVIGIVASHVVEEYGRPAVLVALDGAEGKGSGRSVPGFDLHRALGDCAAHLLRFGGHRAAAGVTVASASVPGFAERFDAVAREALGDHDLRPELHIDAELPLERATDDLERMLRHLAPFGIGNPAPVFAARGVRLACPPRLVGRDGLRLRIVGPGGAELDAIGWGMAALAPSLGTARELDIAYRLERDEYRGESRLQARLADVVPR